MYFTSKLFSYTFRYRLRMFIIEKLAVHTSEEKLKKKVTVQHTSGHVKVSTVYDHHCSAPPRHRLNQISHIVSWYCPPFLLQHLVRLIEGLRWRLSLAHTFIQVFNGIQVRRFGRPWKHIDVVLVKVIHCYTRCVWHSVVLLEYLPLSVNYVHEVRLENFVSVPYCR